MVFNKEDLVDREEVEGMCKRFDGIAISAIRPETFYRLLRVIESKLWQSAPLEDNFLTR